ncbi:hypothetical protein [Litorihabitans aurantiacus]|uniref:Uncharacterized protein n=1 Tax=Litorihabitans aurantiacus TaxID=1930061 RepID=A0AA37XGT9_9MICO|nr:hypothetical protein [Litorihabitans aurantiacus]GMA32617.1 hypothetical protein GCM10025875_26090 [Litorihabitans aurantiacus]
MPEVSSWSARVAAGLEDVLARNRSEHEGWLEWCRIEAVGPDAVEIAYRMRGDTHARGIRMDEMSAQARDHDDLFRDRTPEEIAFYLAHTGVLEPTALGDFGSPGEDGVAWMDADTWMRSVAG